MEWVEWWIKINDGKAVDDGVIMLHAMVGQGNLIGEGCISHDLLDTTHEVRVSLRLNTFRYYLHGH